MKVAFVRHGEASSNKDPDKVGSNEPLTLEGVEQVRAAAGWLLGRISVSQVVSSRYRRCRETSEIIAEALSIDDILIDDRLNEIDKGDWKGMPVEEVIELEAEVDPVERPITSPPHGENWLDLGKRVMECVEERRLKGSREELMVSHNHPIRMGIGMLTGAPLQTWEDPDIANASITMIHDDERGFWHPDPDIFNLVPYRQARKPE